MYSLQEVLLSASMAMYIAISVVVAIVRWGHRCEPYAAHMDYYFPSWRTLIFCGFANLVLFPTVFMPSEPDAILQLRFMLILGPPFMSAVLVFSYFGKVLQLSWWRRPVYVQGAMFAVVTLIALVLALVPGDQLTGAFGRRFYAVGGIMSLVFLGVFGMSLRMLGKAINRVAEENYSNPEDFPRQYAIHILWLSSLFVIVSWVGTTIGTTTVLTITMTILSGLAVYLLLGVLSPHRAMDAQRLGTGEIVNEPADTIPSSEAVAPSIEIGQKTSPAGELALSPERREEIVRAIRRFVEEEKGYLDCHLTLASLSRSIGINRTYVSSVMSDSLGGFFTYVNRCRMAHAARLKEEQPDLAIADLALASGFGSRQSYYNVRKQLA